MVSVLSDAKRYCLFSANPVFVVRDCSLATPGEKAIALPEDRQAGHRGQINERREVTRIGSKMPKRSAEESCAQILARAKIWAL